MQIKGVLLDMDGVLVDSEAATAAISAEALNRLGIPAQTEDFRPYIGTSTEAYLGGVARKYGREYDPAMATLLFELYCEKIAGILHVYPGTRSTLERLHAAGVPMALATSADIVKARANMQAADIPLSIFDAVVTGSDVERCKPYPDIYLRAAAALGLNARDCMVVEDSISGIRAGLAAGARVAGIATAFDCARLIAEGAAWAVESLEDILAIIGI